MTSRSSFASKRRPLSAIFLGDGPTASSSTSSTSELPDLPEPPSPGAASTHSGLPSPPATNSTGSGSTGDSREAVDLHSMPSPSSALTMRNERQSTSRSSRASSPAGGGEYRREEGDDEEDATARLNLGRRRGASQSNDHVVTLQRVMSLTQRNRMALNKLSSMRLNTPSPSQSSRSSRSPRPPVGASTSGSSTSTSASVSNRSRSVEPATLSGSETEREPSAAYSYSSDDQSITPPSSVSHAFSVLDGRLRRTSLPASPSKGRTASSIRSYSPNSTQRTPKKRISTISVPDPEANREYEQNNVTYAALATVASLRRSPGSSGKKNRQPLPREFREPRRASSDGRASKEPTTPQKPSRERYSSLISDTSPSRTFVRRTLNNQQSPPRSSQFSRLSTTRKHPTRWMSEDLRSTSSRSIVDDNDDDPLSSGSDHASRQAARTLETPPSVRLVGEGLRAAGVKVKNNGADVFHESEHTPGNAKGTRRPTPISTILSHEREGVISPNKVITPLHTVTADDLRTPANGSSLHRAERVTYSGPQPRPKTSMADFRPINEDLPPNTAPAAVRTYKASFTYDRDRDREGMVSRQALYTPFSTAPQDRTYGSQRTRPRETPALPLDEQAIEHLRLMDESLTMFEGQLSRLPPMGDTSTTTVPEVFRNAQAVVRFSEQVNGMLRNATNRSLDRLIETEVSDANPNSEVDMVGLWKDIGGDFRDMLRVSDELVRTMTGFLLGVGKVLRESSAISVGAGSTLQHLRGASDDLSRRSGTDARSSTSGTGSGRGSGSGDGIGGRRSTESRRSWDLPRVERDRADLLRRASSRVDTNALSSQRAPSAMLLRDPPRRQSPLGPTEDVSPAPTRAPLGSSIRRLFTPGPQREREGTPSASAKPELATIESQKSLHIEEDDYVPSPSPAPHSRQPDGNTRKLRPLSIPNPIPALPSESRADQQPFPTTVDKSINRRRISTTSTATLRGSTNVNPGLNITTPSAAPTTAVTPHTATPVVPPAVSRTESSQSSSSANSSKRHSTTITFSRPSAVSVSALNGLQQRDARNRTTSASNEGPGLGPGAPTPTTPLSAISPWTSQSGSETERPQARMTLGRRTIGAKSHLSLDAPPPGGGTQTLARSTARERRRTITQIFS